MTSQVLMCYSSRIATLVACVLLAGCTTLAPVRHLECDSAPRPTVINSADGKRQSTTIRVLTYNLEGLGFPARVGRAAKLRRIRSAFIKMHAQNGAPDIVLFQEMFSSSAKAAVARSGFPAIVPGPKRETRSPESNRDALPGKSKLQRGELGFRLLGSGLAVASRYPIVASETRPLGLGPVPASTAWRTKG